MVTYIYLFHTFLNFIILQHNIFIHAIIRDYINIYYNLCYNVFGFRHYKSIDNVYIRNLIF